MGAREIHRDLEQWEMDAKDVRRRMILAPTPREMYTLRLCGRKKTSGFRPSTSPARLFTGVQATSLLRILASGRRGPGHGPGGPVRPAPATVSRRSPRPPPSGP